MTMKELQDFPKIPSELMEKFMKLTLRYFEERSRVSCMYLSFFLSAFRFDVRLMTCSLLRYEEETPVSNKKNSQVMKSSSICEDCDAIL